MSNWNLKFDKKAFKELSKLDKQVQQKIFSELDRILLLPHPKEVGKFLTGNLSGLWRYRVGDYRIVTRIEDNILTILVVRVAHRKEIYN